LNKTYEEKTFFLPLSKNFIPVGALLKNEFGDANIWLVVISSSFIIVSVSMSFVCLGLVSINEKFFALDERPLGIFGLAIEFVVVVDEGGVLVKEI
jgi:hypothetical protein